MTITSPICRRVLGEEPGTALAGGESGLVLIDEGKQFVPR